MPPASGRLCDRCTGPTRRARLPGRHRPEERPPRLEIADGALGLLWNPRRWRDAYGADLFDGAREAFDFATTVWVAAADDLAACRDVVRRRIAFYVGAMGPPGNNYYAELVGRYGPEEAADKVAACYRERRPAEAAACIPDGLVDDLGLVGPRSHIADQLAAWRDGPVGTIIVDTDDESTW